MASLPTSLPAAASPAAAASAPQAVEQTAVLDPFAFLAALAQPLLAARDACVRFVSSTTAVPPSLVAESPEADADANAGADALTQIEREASVIERSFASEFATLMSRPSLTPEFDTAESRTAYSDAAPERHRTLTTADVDPLATTTAGASPSIPETDAHRIVLRSSSPLVRRAVPLTRLPLRPQDEITWTTELAGLDFDGESSRTQRHALLERSVRDASLLAGAVLARAYREEDLDGRTIALRALCRHHPAEGKAIFVEALRLGSDDERALAIDGLTSIGAHADLVPAFGDRVDAVAAKAALAYVGTRSRDEYRDALAPYVDAAQVAKILSLLAGIVE